MSEPFAASIEGTASPRSRRGVVGPRDLVGIQTFEIARLTTHAVPLVAGVFVAVSGVGPDGDSNGSGKTSFLSAVSLLLADPQWRLDINGGKHAAGLLFRPESAGVDPAQEFSAAPYGYVVGVFAGNAETLEDPVTVWVRVSATSPYVEARWKQGLHVADADTDGERVLQADDLWRRCSASNSISAKRMAEVLYGEAPRCLTYLDTPLRPAVPSLLSQQMTEMEPKDIGVSLIALAGMGGDLATEAKLRSQYLDKDRELAEAIKDAAEAHALEEAELAGVRARQEALRHITSAKQAWRRYLALRVHTAHTTDQKISDTLTQHRDLYNQAHEVVDALREQIATFPKKSELEKAERDTEKRWGALRGLVEGHRVTQASIAQLQSKLSTEKNGLRTEADGWTGITVEAAEQALSDAQRWLERAKAAESDARRATEAAQDNFRRTQAGLAGVAGTAIELLREHNIDGIALLDAAEFPEDIRSVWEARLWPWRDAIVVRAGSVEEARDLLASRLPGAQVITAAVAPDTQLPTALGHEALDGFLQQLEQHAPVRGNGGGVIYQSLGVSVAGGFAPPVAGRQARIEAARTALNEARTLLEAAQASVKTGASRVTLAEADATAARARVRITQIDSEMREHAAQIATIDEQLVELNGQATAAQDAWKHARTALDTRTQALELAESKLKLAVAEQEARAGTVRTVERQREALCLATWLNLWGESAQAADELLANEPVRRRNQPESLRRACSESLLAALQAMGVDDARRDDAPEDLKQAANLREQFSDDGDANGPSIVFGEVSAPLLNRLAGATDADRVNTERIAALRAQRTLALEVLHSEALQSGERLENLQDMLQNHIEGILESMSRAFNELDVARGGAGASIEYSTTRPQGAGEWHWHVTPRWRRSRRGGMVSYLEISHGAQVKVHAIMLVLAAMLADAEPEGRVLVLDELGNSLGEVNRRETLSALHAVAQRKHVTILGTCQDSVLSDAADYCGQLLWFEHPTNDHAYNQPTRAWGFDADSQRVEQTSAWVRTGRPYV